jgi:XTP/dITP diphosphohydrolase
MADILLATQNDNKKRELKALFKDISDIRVLTVDDLNFNPPIIVEDGKTFRQNAVKKAVIMSKFFPGLTLADDSGLEVESLHGKPGVRSSRFARANATDEENNRKLLNLIESVPQKSRKARFVCNMALARNGALLSNFEGVVVGEITEKPRGKNGFGYDPLFLPKGKDKTFAEMAARDKNVISHRALALKKLKMSIGKYLKTS